MTRKQAISVGAVFLLVIASFVCLSVCIEISGPSLSPSYLRDLMLAPGPDLTPELASGDRRLVEAAISGLYTKSQSITPAEAELAIHASLDGELISDAHRQICLRLFERNPVRMSMTLSSLLESGELILDSPRKIYFVESAIEKLKSVPSHYREIENAIEFIQDAVDAVSAPLGTIQDSRVVP